MLYNKKIWWNRIFTKVIRSLKNNNKMKLFNIWSWPAELIDDIRCWNIVRIALKEEPTKILLSSFKYKLRIDSIGRLYTVINIPEEFYEDDKQKLVWAWMVEQLRDLDDILMKCQLSEFLYPSVRRIDDINSFAYLVVLTTSTESLSFFKFLKWLLNIGLIYLTFFILNKIFLVNFNHSVFDFIKNTLVNI